MFSATLLGILFWIHFLDMITKPIVFMASRFRDMTYHWARIERVESLVIVYDSLQIDSSLGHHPWRIGGPSSMS